jgi:DNA ligase (NAD+)
MDKRVNAVVVWLWGGGVSGVAAGKSRKRDCILQRTDQTLEEAYWKQGVSEVNDEVYDQLNGRWRSGSAVLASDPQRTICLR